MMSSRQDKQAERKEEQQLKKTEKVTSPGAKGRGLDENAGEVDQSQQSYERIIKEEQGELDSINELRGRQFKAAQEGKEVKLSKEDEEKLRNAGDEESRIRNKVAQLRSEANRKGYRLNV